MDVQEERYRRVMNQFRGPFANLINEYPIGSTKQFSQGKQRNLKYIVNKYVLSSGYPFHNSIYDETIEDIKNSLTDSDQESRVLAVRIARVLPFLSRIKLIEMCENQITNAILAVQKKDQDTVLNPYGYEFAADFSQFLLSVFELTCQSQDIYFDVNQRIITIFSRFFESSVQQNDKNLIRNGCEVLRNIFWCFGSCVNRTESIDNKLISKLVSTFIPPSSFVNKQEVSMLSSSMLSNSYSDRTKNNTKLLNLILRCRQFQVRQRARQFYGFCCLTSYLPQMDYQILDLLVKQIFIILQNISECDVSLECFSCLASLLSQQQGYYTRSQIVKKWYLVISEIGYKKQFLEYYIFLLEVASRKQFQIPHKLKYALSIYTLELTKNIQQQYTRFIIYNLSCKIIIQISRQSYKRNQSCNLLLNIFQYPWFIDRITQQNDLFQSQFLISLLHCFASANGPSSKPEVVDLLDLCHRLIDWKCTCKEETHIPTLKFAFDLYLNFLQAATQLLQDSIEPSIIQLINRCNQASIYFLFKFKLIDRLLQLPWYQINFKYLQNAKLQFQIILDQIRLVMMPKNPKPIFLYEYSLTYDGQIESRKEIQYIKIIMSLLQQISKIHQTHFAEIDQIIIDYHRYLMDLQAREDSNKQLINCLQTLEGDYYFNQCQRYFLLSLIPNPLNIKTINHQTNLQDLLLYSHCESVQCQDQVNIFGPMSPVQLTIKLHGHSSYSAVYLHIKKNMWVQAQGELKMIVSSGIEKKEVPFQSSILDIKIDRIGSLHFQVWKGVENDLLLGSGNYRIKRKLKWMKVNHLSIIDGIKTKAYFKEVEPGSPRQTYLSYYYGQPILIQILKSHNEVVVSVSSKQTWNQIRQVVSSLALELASGSAYILQQAQYS